jgi:prepilin peptidase CpaA
MLVLQAPLLVALALLLIAAAVLDLRSRIIPNSLNAAIALLALPWWLAAGLSGYEMLFQFGTACTLLLMFAACFAAGMMGGGDVKLIAALALWLPFGAVLTMLVWMALGGGLLTLVMLAVHKLRKASGRPEVPYGVAIAASALMIVANDILTTAAA